MTQQPTWPHPLSYTVWYEHVSGRNQNLGSEIDRLTPDGTTLDAAQTHRLDLRKVLDLEWQTAVRQVFDVRLSEFITSEDLRECLLAIEIDHVKQVNDRQGHLFGDQVLRAVGEAMHAGRNRIMAAA